MIDIYCVESNENVSQMIKEFLEQHGYKVLIFRTSADAKQALEDKRPTLVIVDHNMPDGGGGMLCRWICLKWEMLPVILLTAPGDSDGAVLGLPDSVDCIEKPFGLGVLFSHILAQLRKTGDVSNQYLSCGNILVDQKRMLVFCKEEEISLNPAEYKLLLFFLQNQGKTATRKELLEKVWDIREDDANDNTLTVAMKRLREKLHKPSCLKTVRSVGYRMEEV